MVLLLRALDSPTRLPFLSISLVRVALGLFFAASGWNKTVTAPGRAAMAETIRSIGAPVPDVTAAVVAGCELVFGLLLAVGLVTRAAAAVLGVISTVALTTVAVHQLRPADAVTWYGDLLYLPEVLYLLLAVVLVALGGGPFGLDRVLRARVAALRARRTRQTG
ncbi:DoxX family protein [Curtobacterium sp. GD1]|uniref:DoxX family protein n=1 Tax=Curtobacterium sp. GD1 TaxID=2810612 RepID=UPI001E3E0FA0|nr:DoxX family protein [Curtobacterium sp. GD1]MCC8906817.1 DoxX family protein [Curtobacterium sp. GD1]